MSQSEPEAQPIALKVGFSDTSNLPIPHVNALRIHTGSDEFIFTLGVIVPPDQEEMVGVMEAGHVVAQPVFRFAISHDTMERFLTLMADQFDQQTAFNKRSYQQDAETSQKEGSRND